MNLFTYILVGIVILGLLFLIYVELTKKKKELEPDAVHSWFGLSYSSYLVLQRSIMQSMDDEWQNKMVALLDEAHDKFNDKIPDQIYLVSAQNATTKKYETDPLKDYQRGRRNLNNE